MNSQLDWRRLARHAALRLEGDAISVRFDGGRGHRVEVVETEGGLTLRAIAARKAVWQAAGVPIEQLWQRNRSLQLVGLRVDDRERLVAEAWLASDGLTADELALSVRTVAAEADRIEFWLTGADVE